MKKVSLLLMSLFLISLFSLQAQELTPVVRKAAFHDTSKPLRDIAPAQHNDAVKKWKDGLVKNNLGYKNVVNYDAKDTDPKTVQTTNGSKGVATPIIDFEGTNNLSGVAPPDTDGDVGPNHYVQMVNSKLQVFDKSGNSLYGPVDNSTIWSGFSGAWTGTNDGDPVVLYDQDADRWLVTQFAVNTSDGSQWLLVAVSATADPTGSYNRYAFEFDNMPDYPHFGIWSDGYYVSVNQFNVATSNFEGAGVAAFERDEMIAGNDANMVFFDMGSDYGNLLPADCDGAFPTLGTPNYFTYFNDDAWGGDDQLEIWEFHVDWANTENSTYQVMNSIPVTSFDSDINGSTNSYSRDNLSQPGTSDKLHAMTDRLMYRLQFRDFGTYQAMVCNHTIDVGSERAGVRWYELRRTTGDWSKYQEGTYAPDDGENRWMGSIAMNANGDIALGYSVVSGSTYPSIRYTGRLSTDPLNTMTISETEIIASTASQTGVNRWGDYSCMSVDPSNDLTFWYTQEYTSGGWDWLTRIASFNLEDFGDPAITASPISTSQIDLSWTQNSDGDNVMIAWSADGTFGTPNDGTSYSAGNTISGGGTVLYVGSLTDFNHTSLEAGTTYYYKAWSLLSATPDYSPGVTTSATTLKESIFYDGFETDAGWTFNGEWERDAPQGLQGDTHGNPDPTVAFNGSNVLGVDLTGDGDYQGSLTDHQETAVSPVIDCSNFENIEIKFQRWLGVESPTYDHAYIDISTDGGNTWTEIWTNTGSTIDEDSWSEQTFDVSTYADEQATVQVRFSMGVTDDSWNYCGWNLDDFYVLGTYTSVSASIAATPGCGTGSVTVSSNMSGTQTFYLRDNSGGAISDWTGDATSHEFTGLADGTYKGQVEKDAELSELSNAVILTNDGTPIAPTSVQATETNICNGENTTLSYTGGSGTNFVWYSGSCGGTSASSTVSPTATTTYYGRWENTCGESDCESIEITVNDLITANAGSDDNTCNAIYQLQGNNPTPGTGEWTITAGAASITNEYLYNTDITISSSPVTVAWTTYNGACENTDDVTITLDEATSITTQPQDVNATVGDDVSFSVVAEGANLTYQWKFEGADIDGANQATYQILSVTMDDAGNYSVNASGSCGDNVLSENALLSVATSIEELNKMGINIYPNPTTGLFNIQLPADYQNSEVIITDVTGKIIHQENVSGQKTSINLNVEKGVYLIKFNFNEKTVISTIVVE